MTGLLNFLGGAGAADGTGPDFSGVSGAARYQAFRFIIQNTAGVLEHRFVQLNSRNNVDAISAGALVDKVTGASKDFSALPSGPNSTTDFTAGAKVSNDGAGATAQVILNTPDQTAPVGMGVAAEVSFTNTGTAILARPLLFTKDVNGVTRQRVTITYLNAATAAVFVINTTNIPTGKIIWVDVQGFIL